MDIHRLAFWICVFFIFGVFLISIFQSMAAVLLLALLLSLCFLFFKNYYFASLVLLLAAGAFYYQIFGYWQERVNIPFGAGTEFSGIIKNLESSDTKQEIILELGQPYSGRIRIIARPYPAFKYGDLLRVKGIIREFSPDSKNYFAKNRIFGTTSFPKIEFFEAGHGNFIRAFLLDFKNRILAIFNRALPQEKAALLAGLTLGERGNFSKELKNKMSLSGTTHLVALSGYNISVIAWAATGILGLYLSRSISFYLSVLVIILFVLMTGAEASVVRAAIMGIIAIFAKETERFFSMRNAIVIAAFLMILHNPKVLVFDLGFQLSFAALLGIVYLLPALKKIFKFQSSGFLNWKENSLTALSAQLAVVPFLLGNFGIFSLTSFFSNVLIAEAIPITMGLGFIMAGLGFFSRFAAEIVGLAANVFLSYELWIIDIFSRFTLPVAAELFGFLPAAVYYLFLILLIYKFYGRRRPV